MAEKENNMKNLYLNTKNIKIASKGVKTPILKIEADKLAVLGKKLVAEFLGTYLLVFAGTGAIILEVLTGNITHFGVSLIFGLTLMITFYMFSHISGAHVNPAVTLGYLIRKDITLIEAIGYVISQVLGALAASWTLYQLFGESAYLGAPIAYGTVGQTFTLEFILTFFLVVVTLNAAYDHSSKTYSGMAMGATLFVATFIAGPLTGAVLNPARIIGPAIIAGNPSIIGIYLFATLSSSVIATTISYFLNE